MLFYDNWYAFIGMNSTFLCSFGRLACGGYIFSMIVDFTFCIAFRVKTGLDSTSREGFGWFFALKILFDVVHSYVRGSLRICFIII